MEVPVSNPLPRADRRHHRSAAALLLVLAGGLCAEDIEPRRWTPLPVGTTVVGIGVVKSRGDVAFDPVLEIEDATVEVTTKVASIIHGFGLFGRSARFEVRLPNQHAHWDGLLDGEQRTVDRRGPADPRLRLAVDLIGAPALTGREFAAHRSAHPVNTVIGAAVAVTLPLGEYLEEKLLNLGQNRFSIQPPFSLSWAWSIFGAPGRTS